MVLCSSCCSKKKPPPSCSKSCPKKKIISKTVKVSKTTVVESKPAATRSVYAIPIADRPVPYTFRVPTTISNFRHAGSRYAKCPPFYLQLDHVLAVIWCLFSPEARDKKFLGISQLEWALYFLRGVKNSSGKHPPDVAIAIRAVEDSLLECRTDMSELIMRTPIQVEPCMDCEYKSTSQRSVCGVCTNASLAYLPRKTQPANYKQKTAELNASNRSQINYNASTMDSNIDSIMAPKFSSTLIEGSKTSSTSQKKRATSSTSTSESCEALQNKICELKALISQISADDLGEKDESNLVMSQLLDGWHKHQIAKIQEEINKLHSIEILLKQDRETFTSSIS